MNNRKRRGFVIYTPKPSRPDSTDAYYVRYVFHRYKQNRARRVKPPGRPSHLTKQIEVCAIGGGQARGGNRLSRVVSMMTMRSATDRLVGQKWDTGTEVGTAHAKLSFQVPVKPVTISGSLDVNATYTLTGGQGPDKQGPDRFDPYVHNQVNAAWEGSSTFIWQGSTHFQGNVGHALWELPQKSRTPSIYYYQNHERFCGHYHPLIFPCA